MYFWKKSDRKKSETAELKVLKSGLDQTLLLQPRMHLFTVHTANFKGCIKLQANLSLCPCIYREQLKYLISHMNHAFKWRNFFCDVKLQTLIYIVLHSYHVNIPGSSVNMKGRLIRWTIYIGLLRIHIIEICNISRCVS